MQSSGFAERHLFGLRVNQDLAGCSIHSDSCRKGWGHSLFYFQVSSFAFLVSIFPPRCSFRTKESSD